MKIRPLESIDFYKAGHKDQYPENTEFVYSNFTARSSRLAPVLEDFDDKVVFLGLQGFIKEFLIETWNKEFFSRRKEEVLAEYKRRMDSSLGVDAISIEHISELHDLGYLPLVIKALPEGSRVNIKVPMLTVMNTDKRFYWLTNYIETAISAMVWKSCTTATIAYEYKRLLNKYADLTGSPKEFVAVQGHDFSARGMSGIEDAARSGLGHLTSFIGTDTVSAIGYAEDYYNAMNTLVGISVPATEHSVMCMGGKESEIETFRRLITKVYPKGIVSIVSDTWDFWKVITEYAVELKEEILSREPNELGLAKVVFRPDSGNPVKVICGWDYTEVNNLDDWSLLDVETKVVKCDGRYYLADAYDTGWTTKFELSEISESEVKGAVECLWDVFGGTVNDKGYKVLNERVGLIYGDSITLERAKAILEGLEAKGFASCNIVFGIGSYTYQHVTRDSFGFAMKATYGIINGENVEIFKDPVTDRGDKKSAKGLLCVGKEGDDFVLYDQQTPEEAGLGELKTVFYNGGLLVDWSLEDIRAKLC
jgi:nicotinamide phosphoribosyltransferase